jgi:adenylate cyclase
LTFLFSRLPGRAQRFFHKVHIQVYAFRKNLYKNAQGDGDMELDIIQAIELAIAHELEARKSYLALAEGADDPELKRLLQEIAQEEAGHEASLRSRLRLYEQKRFLRDTLSRYLSPAMCQEILDNPESLQLGGQRRHLTVLFADIIGFTSLSEKMDPGDVVAVLNEYFRRMVEVVFEHQGTLDKFLGDGLMVFFGAPLEVPQAASQAVSCALGMHRCLAEMQAQKLTPIRGMRIGVNTGEAIVGNIGSEKRMDFTIIGDVVNVAARLLEVAKDINAGIIISESTFREVEGKFPTEPAPSVVLRGRQVLTVSYQVKV